MWPIHDSLWPNFAFLSLMPFFHNLLAKFEVSSLNRPQDMKDVYISPKVGHMTHPRPSLTNFASFSLLPLMFNRCAKF